MGTNPIDLAQYTKKATGDSVITLETVDSDILKNTTVSVGGNIASLADSTISAKAANAISIDNAGIALKDQYTSKNGSRLVAFEYTSGDDDDQRRAYLRLLGPEEGFNDLIKDTQNTSLQAIISELKSDTGFRSFILTSLTENFQEKQSIIQTINDYFITTFSGQEPQIIQISGILPFDAASYTSSWFLNFINAYKFIFRASILAKYKLQLYIILPDFSKYRCYPISFSSGVQSNQDNLTQFQMNAIVVQEDIQEAKGISASVSTPSTLSEKVAANITDTKNKETSGDNQDPKDVGKKSALEKALNSTRDFINTIATGQGTNEVAKTINKVNRILGSAKIANKVITSAGNIFGVRTGVKLF